MLNLAFEYLYRNWLPFQAFVQEKSLFAYQTALKTGHKNGQEQGYADGMRDGHAIGRALGKQEGHGVVVFKVDWRG